MGQWGVLLIFDGDCGFCTSSAEWVERQLPDQARVAPWQILDLAEFGLTEHDVRTAAYWVDPTGQTYRGHRGIGRTLIAIGGVWSIVGRLIVTPPISWVARPVYAIIAKYRHLMPGASDACRVELDSTAERPDKSA